MSNTVTLQNIYPVGSTNNGIIGINNSTQNYPLQVDGALNISGPDADLIIDGSSIKDTLTKINQRLLILQPKAEDLEKYQALKNAYEHYKMLEALCFGDKNESN